MLDYTDLINTKFLIHGRNKEEGFDCYGLAIEVLRRNGIELHDYFYNDINQDCLFEDIKKGFDVVNLLKPEKNCIIAIKTKKNPNHIGVYIGDDKFIHATVNYGVKIESLYKWKSQIEGYYKVNN